MSDRHALFLNFDIKAQPDDIESKAPSRTRFVPVGVHVSVSLCGLAFGPGGKCIVYHLDKSVVGRRCLGQDHRVLFLGLL